MNCSNANKFIDDQLKICILRYSGLLSKKPLSCIRHRLTSVKVSFKTRKYWITVSL